MGFFSACCSAMKIEMKVVYEGVDPELNLTSYTKELDMGESVKLEYVIPEGFDHEGFKVLLNNEKEIPWSVTYEDPYIEPQYAYTVQKRITFSVEKLIDDFTLNIDLSEVKRRALQLTVSDSILDITSTNRGKVDEKSNLSIISIDPSCVNNLTRVDESKIIARRDFNKNKATVYYGEYVIICYNKLVDHKEIPTLYTDVNRFSRTENITSIDTINFCQFDVAVMGARYYHLIENNTQQTKTRLFYFGQVKENFNIYNKIPNYTSPKGFVLNDEENKFSLLTNPTKYNSDLLSINVFSPSVKTYDPDDNSLDQVDGLTLNKINSAELFKNRYDRFDMYVGNDRQFDIFLTEEERSNLPNSLYVSVESEIIRDVDVNDVLNYLNIHLLHYEKQGAGESHLTFLQRDILESDKGALFIKLDINTIRDFLDNKINNEGNVAYITGNAILYVAVDPDYVEESRKNKKFPYSVIDYPTYYNDVYRGIDTSYNYEFYILNEDSTKDYGFLDMHKWSADVVYFRTDKLFKSEVFQDNLFLNAKGKDYNEYYNELIISINVKNGSKSLFDLGYVSVEDPYTYNALDGVAIKIKDRYPGDQYTLKIYVSATPVNENNYNVSFDNLTFNNSEDVIYMTNNYNFDDSTDFVGVSELSKAADYNIIFGVNTEIYYFVKTDDQMEFDLYVNSNESERKLSKTKRLVDVAGNAISISVNGKQYDVYIKYQAYDIFGTAAAEYLAFTNQ